MEPTELISLISALWLADFFPELLAELLHLSVSGSVLTQSSSADSTPLASLPRE
jgi:hypothetical protein